MLKAVCRVETIFPSALAEFPVVIITEIANTSGLVFNNRERISDIAFQLDVWDNNVDRCRVEEISADVDRVMLGVGFTRTFGQAFKEKSLHRKCLRYSGRVDLENYRVYGK